MCNAGLLHNKMEPRRADFIFIFNYYPCRFFLQIQSLHFLLSLSIFSLPHDTKTKRLFLLLQWPNGAKISVFPAEIHF